VNEQGVAHYDDLIASLVASGIKPAITLFHWGKYNSFFSIKHKTKV
jgi:beta-glucosidase/6-phospho-beta-glucosidase/beta-galactosidase